jgi:glycosyltransferase involved in cell wall biosynthesis
VRDATALHTFVVPAYGRSAHLRECLSSLRGQSAASNIVIATSTPYDGLEEVATEYGARLATHSPNAGIGHDWNFALAQADTPWVTLAHQDDLYLPKFLERTLEAVQAHPRAALVFTGYRELEGGTRRASSAMLAIKRVLLELGFLGRGSLSATGAKLRLLRLGCPIPCPAVTLDLQRLSDLRFREDLRVNLDWDAWIRAAHRPVAFAWVREPLMLHRIHGVSETTAAIRQGVRAAEDRMMFEALWPAPVARMLARAYTLSYETGAG